MNKRIVLEEQGLRDLRHLASEIAPLLLPTQVSADSRRQARELAETAFSLLRSYGPVKTEADGYTLAMRAATSGRVELLSWDEVEGAERRRFADLLHPDAWALWLHLETAEYCPERLYADLTRLTDLFEQRPTQQAQAEQRWAEAEQQLRAEGLLPVRVLAPPSAAGGARFVHEVLLSDELLPALRETLADWGGYIIAHRPGYGGIHPARYYTLSLHTVADLWTVGSLFVFQHYANRSEASSHAGQ